jgi:hypothetical protein
MTVRELIERLQAMEDQDATVCVPADYGTISVCEVEYDEHFHEVVIA